MIGLTDIVKGDLPLGQLTQENTETPDVCLEGVPRIHVQQDFRGCIAKSPAIRIGPVILPLTQALGEAKVNQLNVACLIYHDVVRFEVSIDDVLLVQHLEGTEDLGRVELRPVLVLLARDGSFPIQLILYGVI